MPFHLLAITLLLFASMGVSLTLVRVCEMEISSLERQKEEIRLGIAELREVVDP